MHEIQPHNMEVFVVVKEKHQGRQRIPAQSG